MRTALRALLTHLIRGLLHPSIERGVVRGRVLMRSCAVLITRLRDEVRIAACRANDAHRIVRVLICYRLSLTLESHMQMTVQPRTTPVRGSWDVERRGIAVAFGGTRGTCSLQWRHRRWLQRLGGARAAAERCMGGHRSFCGAIGLKPQAQPARGVDGETFCAVGLQGDLWPAAASEPARRRALWARRGRRRAAQGLASKAAKRATRWTGAGGAVCLGSGVS